MSKSRRITMVAELAARNERRAARSVAESRRELAQRESRLNELEGYREDYARQLQDGVRQGTIGAQHLKRYDSFLRRLSEGVAHAETRVGDAVRDTAHQAQIWRERLSRSRALGKVLERYRDAERKTEQRRSQRQLDDRAARREEE